MNAASLFRSYADAWRVWVVLGLRFSEMLLASSQVIAYRTERMRTAGSNPRADDIKEFALMKQEKLDAGFESAQAMAMESIFASQRYAAFAFGQFFSGMPALLSLALPGTHRQVARRQLRLVRTGLGRSALSASKLSGETGKIAQRALTPIRTRAGANAKRLRKLQAK
ncbi:MAG TPA: polyhydroxyalkanoate granule-associated phasin [Burkholderiales bacterium]|nr:polyhydroxyalkanoate granule-associated phasin [Burkholderiales bacterium]